jgi:hypothetical protein
MSGAFQRRLDRLEHSGDAECVHVEIVRFSEGPLPDPVPCASGGGVRLSYIRPGSWGPLCKK